MTKNISENVIEVVNLNKTFHSESSSRTIKEAFINLGNAALGKKSYHSKKGDYTALKGVSFAVKKSEFFGIVGRNGSGKSTLLKILAGVYSPTNGSVRTSGKLTPFIELGVGFNPELSGKDNVYLNGALLGFTRKQMDAMYDEIVDFAELNEFMDTKLKNYSSGMQVRLAFSVAIRAQSDILLLDEVLAVGDAAFQKKCFDYFMQLKKNKQTVILVTHDMSAVRQYCDRVALIDKGVVKFLGTAERGAQEYQKMFSEDLSKSVNQTGTVKAKEDRWGSGSLKATASKVKLNKDSIQIDVDYKAFTNLDTAILGFTIYNSKGVNILEGNTLRMRQPVGSIKKGMSYSISWEIPNILATGTYNIAVACCDLSATKFYDWLNNAAEFTIEKHGNTAGVVDPKIILRKVEITNG
jgi:ABC-2 type transport system ATP-binding protein